MEGVFEHVSGVTFEFVKLRTASVIGRGGTWALEKLGEIFGVVTHIEMSFCFGVEDKAYVCLQAGG